jgi:hypothetical protein
MKFITILAVAICCSYPTWAQPATVINKVDLNIVAHEDDDLLLMNPEILEAVKAGRRQVTVYSTAANFRADDLWYTVGREQGAIDGWSRLLQIADEDKAGAFRQPFTETFGGDSKAPLKCTPYTQQLSENPGTVKWQRTQMQVGSRSLEIATTGDAAKPRVMLIFVRLNASRTVWGTPVRYDIQNQDLGARTLANLSMLFNGPPDTLIRSPDGRRGYTKEQLLSLLSDIFNLLRPGVVRTQDSSNPNPADGNPDDPDKSCDPSKGIPCSFIVGGSHYDHSDHYWSARFAREALRRYRVIHPAYRPVYTIYAGYYMEWTQEQGDRLSTKNLCFKKSILYFYGLNDSAMINDDPAGASSPFITFAYPHLGYQKGVISALP